MNKLNDEQKVYVVRRLAGFDSPGAIINSMQTEYGITLSRMSVRYYNPETFAGRRCPDKWKTLFFETRNAIREGRVEIGIANKMVRLRWLEGLMHDAVEKGKPRLATQILKQAATEMGEKYTNRHKHEHSSPPERQLTDAERARRFHAIATSLGLVILPASSVPKPFETPKIAEAARAVEAAAPVDQEDEAHEQMAQDPR